MTDQELIAPDLPQQRDPTNSTLGSGWYKVADSQDVGSMEAIQVDDFPTQIVVWRGADNQLVPWGFQWSFQLVYRRHGYGYHRKRIGIL